MGFVALASFDDTLSISHKRNIKNLFFSWEISYRTAVSFFMVRSVADIFPENLPTCLAMLSFAFLCFSMFFCLLLSLFIRKQKLQLLVSHFPSTSETKKTTILSCGAKAKFHFQFVFITIFISLYLNDGKW